MSSPRERQKRDRRDSRARRDGQGRKKNSNESEETEEIKKKTFPLYLTCFKDSRPCPTQVTSNERVAIIPVDEI